MANQQTELCSFPSKFSPNKFVTAAQYITEIICERKALYDTGGKLPTQFWKLDKWAKYYRQQIPSANLLLKKFSASAIIRALSHWKAKKIYSLRAPSLIPLCEQYEIELNKERDKLVDKLADLGCISEESRINLCCDNNLPRPDFGKKTTLSKLKDLDNE